MIYISEPQQTNLTKQFQKQAGAYLALPTIKVSDIATMMRLLQRHVKFEKHSSINDPYVITDIGGDDGSWMLDPFFKLDISLKINVIEPNKNSLKVYKENLANQPKVIPGMFLNTILEKSPLQIIPPANLILCSHSLYYSKNSWEDETIPLEQHLFSKLLKGLQEKGVLCVILQSEDKALVQNQYGIHAELENITYPIMFRLEGKEGLSHADHVSYTHSGIFSKSMQAYAIRLKREKGIDINIFSAPAISQVSLGNINSKENSKGKYIQEDYQASQLLSFYTKGYYDQYTPDEQRRLLDFIKNNCMTPEGRYVMTHVNTVFTITL